MKLARYMGQGRVEIVDEAPPSLPEGGLVVRTLASGLCSGELMAWYMDRKIPHVLGHEVGGIIESSDAPGFDVGAKVFVHHHAPDLTSALTKRGAAVHDPLWRSTKLVPGGMAERFAAGRANLADSFLTPELRAVDAALIEPLGCVMKALRRLNLRGDESIAVVGLGVMGLLFMLACPGAVGCDLSPERRAWARSLGLDARPNEQAEKAEVVIVCPGSRAALEFGLSLCLPDARLCLFAPMPPGELTPLDLHGLYFEDLTLTCSYSCGPEDTLAAKAALEAGTARAEQVVSDFIPLEDLPRAYEDMKAGRILKAMVIFDEEAWQ